MVNLDRVVRGIRASVLIAGMVFGLAKGCQHKIVKDANLNKRTQFSNEERARATIQDNYLYLKHYLTKKKSIDEEEESFGGLSIVAMSNIAEGLVRYSEKNPLKKEEVGSLLEKLVEKATDQKLLLKNFDIKYAPFNTQDFKEDGVYLGHLNIILGEAQKFSEKKEFKELNRKISKYLAGAITNSKDKHLRAYRNLDHKFPADQTAILYSLYLFDKNNQTSLSVKPIEQWLNFMKEKATDEKTGLPLSELPRTRNGNYDENNFGPPYVTNFPRGCGLSFSVRYMSSFAPEKAKELWNIYKEHFFTNYGIVCGFREWPKGIDLPGYGDGGPIILGMGTIATVLGIKAAQEIGDKEIYEKLNSLENKIMWTAHFIDDTTQNLFWNNFLSRAIQFNYE